MRKIRIQNDGQPSYMTRITDAETGENVDYVQRCQIVMDVTEDRHHLPHAWLRITYPVVDIIADAEIRKVCPCCGGDVDERGKSI